MFIISKTKKIINLSNIITIEIREKREEFNEGTEEFDKVLVVRFKTETQCFDCHFDDEYFYEQLEKLKIDIDLLK